MLWPDEFPAAARTAPVILLGSLLWAVFTTMVFFDMLVAFFTLLGIWGVLLAWQGKSKQGWLLTGFALGLGVLAKGPMVLLPVVSVAALAPWWTGTEPRNWKSWYAGMGAALLMGTAFGVAWAVPAALSGGRNYAYDILWGQVAGRVVESFAHRRPWWWYLPLLPGLLFSWLIWPTFWRGLCVLMRDGLDRGARFCLAWAVPVFVLLSLVSGKQPHYLLPLFPAFALLAARAIVALPMEGGRRAALLPGATFILVGLALTVAPHLAHGRSWPSWLGELSPVPGLVLAAMGGAVIMIPWNNAARTATGLTVATVLGLVVLHLGVLPAVISSGFDMDTMSRFLAKKQAKGDPIAHVHKYYGQYQFLGRLEHPLEVIQPEDVQKWSRRHPDGYLILYYRHERFSAPIQPEYSQPYRGGYVAVWSSRALREAPEIIAGSSMRDSADQ